METLNLLERVSFDPGKPVLRTVLPGPGLRVMMLCMRAGQNLAEHSVPGAMTVQALSGRAIFYDGSVPFEMVAGSLVRLEAQRPHRVEAGDDTVLLITLLTTQPASANLQ